MIGPEHWRRSSIRHDTAHAGGRGCPVNSRSAATFMPSDTPPSAGRPWMFWSRSGTIQMKTGKFSGRYMSNAFRSARANQYSTWRCTFSSTGERSNCGSRGPGGDDELTGMVDAAIRDDANATGRALVGDDTFVDFDVGVLLSCTYELRADACFRHHVSRCPGRNRPSRRPRPGIPSAAPSARQATSAQATPARSAASSVVSTKRRLLCRCAPRGPPMTASPFSLINSTSSCFFELAPDAMGALCERRIHRTFASDARCGSVVPCVEPNRCGGSY